MNEQKRQLILISIGFIAGLLVTRIFTAGWIGFVIGFITWIIIAKSAQYIPVMHTKCPECRHRAVGGDFCTKCGTPLEFGYDDGCARRGVYND